MSAPASSLRRYEALARSLEALASPTRLELLHVLRVPQELHEIRVAPSLTREGESMDRSLSRQAIARHLEQLQEAGLVQRVHPEPGEGRRGDSFVLNHERVFAMVDEVRSLSRLQPVPVARAGETIERGEDGEPRLCAPPRLVVAYGRDDGVSHPLHGPAGSAWTIGRAPACHVRLDYDPYVSSENCRIERREDGFHVVDSGSRNGTRVDWVRLPRGGQAPLRPGTLLGVGRSVLAFQA